MLNYSKCTLRTVGYHQILSIYHCFTKTNSRTISRTLMDFKMADTSERRVFCNTILLKYHGFTKYFTYRKDWMGFLILLEFISSLAQLAPTPYTTQLNNIFSNSPKQKNISSKHMKNHTNHQSPCLIFVYILGKEEHRNETQPYPHKAPKVVFNISC